MKANAANFKGKWVLLAIGVAAALLAGACGTDQAPRERSPGPPVVVFYTSHSATGPQMPLFAALAAGELTACCTLETSLWKNLDDLRGLLLAGRGDLWLGGTETFARAAHLGAPVTMLTVSGWRKFFLISRDPRKRGFADFSGMDLHYAPVGAPAPLVLRALESRGLPPIRLVGAENRQLGLMLLKGDVDSAVLPEPQVSLLLDKDPGLRVLEGVADLTGRLTGGQGRIPWAGLAANRQWVADHPDVADCLVEALVRQGRTLAGDPEPGIAALPDACAAAAGGREMIRRSLTRDLVLVERAEDVRPEIEAHLRLVAPDLFERDRLVLPASFFRRP